MQGVQLTDARQIFFFFKDTCLPSITELAPGKVYRKMTLLFSLSLFFFFWLSHAACGILVPLPGIKPGPLAVKALSPNRWTAREFPIIFSFGINCYRFRYGGKGVRGVMQLQPWL